MSIKVFIADDHAVFRSGLRALLERENGIEVVGEAGDATETLTHLAEAAPDVLVLDLSMPGGMSGAQLAEAALERAPRTRVVVLTMHEDEYYLRELFKVGAHAFLLKKSGAEELITAVRAAYASEYFVDSSLGGLAVSTLLAPSERPQEGRLGQLTSREQEVCRMLALGHTNAEAAEQLHISKRTVESHRNSIMSKLDLKNRAALVRFALDNGLLE